MADWFEENDPAKQDWFTANAPGSTPTVVASTSAEQYGQELPSGEELTQIGRENTPAWTEAPAQAVSELIKGMIPHDVESYAAGVFPPLAAFRQGQQLAQGDVSSIPFVGRVPEIMAAEETPALSKERYLTAMKTLMDVGMLAGAGAERAPSPLRTEPLAMPELPASPTLGPGTIAQDVSRALERRFTLQEPPLEAPPEIAPSVPIEQTLPQIPKEPPVFNPELGPSTRPDFEMPLRTETMQLSPAERNGQILERRQGILDRKKELEARAANGEQGLEPHLAAVQAELLDTKTNPVVHPPPPEPAAAPGMGIKQAFSAKGATDILYEKAFEALRTGQDTISGVRDPILARHKAAFDRGEIRSPEDLKIAEEGKGVGGITPEAAARAAVPPEPYTPEAAAARAAQPQGDVGISQARTEAELGPGSVEPGAGAEMGSGLAHGRDYVNKGGDPRLPIRRANTSGMVGKNDVGIVHAELERLRAERSKAAAALETNPADPVLQQNYALADDAQRAWRKELQPVLTKASDALREAHATSMPEADPSTYQGLADLMDEHFKGQRDVTPEMRTAMAKGAKGVRASREIANGEMIKIEDTLARKSGKKVMTPEELDVDLKSELETIFKDCILGA